MDLSVKARIALTPRPLRRREAALEVALLGHCPGRARLSRLLAMPRTLDNMRAVGFGPAVDALTRGTESDLYQLPIPMNSSAEFRDIFPDAHNQSTLYASVLAGDRAWLAQAVDDFFANGGEKLWIVRVPQAAGQDGFLPASRTVLHDIDTLQGLASLLVIRSVAVVGFPDLERLQVPANLPDIPRNRLDNLDPRFLPCGQTMDDGHRERRYPSELVTMPDPRPIESLLRSILSLTAQKRPDITCLFTLPLEYSRELGSPAIDSTALGTIDQIRDSDEGHRLRQMQFLFPYLRGPRFLLRSPVGLVAGLQSAVAQKGGPWRSMSEQPMVTDALPFPTQSISQVLHLRDDPGVGVLQARSGRLSLDDERLVVPALHRSDYGKATDRRYDSFRSAEVGRLLGYIRRQLQALGETMVFNVDYRDPRPRMALEQFFRGLHAQGALRGALPEDAFRIAESHTSEGRSVYEIMIAPAFPIDKLYLTLSNQGGALRTEISHA